MCQRYMQPLVSMDWIGYKWHCPPGVLFSVSQNSYWHVSGIHSDHKSLRGSEYAVLFRSRATRRSQLAEDCLASAC